MAVIATVIVLLQLFLLGSYRITGNKMSETLKAGDCVLVNKLKIGDNPGRNRLVIYTSPLKRDANNRPLIIGRCVGMPNDAVQIGKDGFRINGQIIPDMPQVHPAFRIRKDIKTDILTAMDSLRIPMRDINEDSVSITLRLTFKEKDLLLERLSSMLHIELVENQQTEYEFVIPRRGKSIMINPLTLMVCREAIMNEVGDSVTFTDDKLLIHGVEQSAYYFQNDYYWILSENGKEGVDSRHLGLISNKHIIGNILFCWYSPSPDRRFRKIK